MLSSVDDASHDAGMAGQGERDLVARIRAGEIPAFEALYDEFVSGLIAFAFTQLRSRELAEELVQDLFLSLWKQRDQWVLTGSLKAYMLAALRKRIAGYLRTNAARHELRQSTTDGVLLYEFPGPEHTDDRVRRADLQRAIERAVAALPPRRREVFLLIRQQQLSYAETAALLGISVKAVEMHMLRAFEGLRAQLADWRG